MLALNSTRGCSHRAMRCGLPLALSERGQATANSPDRLRRSVCPTVPFTGHAVDTRRLCIDDRHHLLADPGTFVAASYRLEHVERPLGLAMEPGGHLGVEFVELREKALLRVAVHSIILNCAGAIVNGREEAPTSGGVTHSRDQSPLVVAATRPTPPLIEQACGTSW
jgi:hypothetical protein